MGMVVRSNVMAVNAFRQLGMNNSQVSKSLEKLSSGFRINRAGDDASGLAISEKMKAQIKGLETASSNSQDGISLIQTAEGALTEVHDMLNRMVELAGKAANGTMDDTVDRQALQNEVDELVKEINRIAEGTNFNGIKLLDGSLAGTAAAGGAAKAAAAPSTTPVTDIAGTWGGNKIGAGADVAATAGKFTLDTTKANTGITDWSQAVDVEITYTGADGKESTVKLTGVKGATDAEADFKTALKAAVEGNTDLAKAFTIDTNGVMTAKTAGAGKETVTGIKFGTTEGKFTEAAGTDATKSFDLSATPQAGDKITIDGKEYTFDAAADGSDGATFKDLATLKAAAAKNGVTLETGTDTAVTATKAAANAGQGGLILQIGDTGADFNQMEVKIEAMNSVSLGIDGIKLTDQASARTMLSALRGDLAEGGRDKGAINKVSENRARLGALQNRLEHTINNLDVAAENMTAANSRIRDTDMAKQMMEYTKMNVLTQSAQAMLAQANQQPQSVLQLLQ